MKKRTPKRPLQVLPAARLHAATERLDTVVRSLGLHQAETVFGVAAGGAQVERALAERGADLLGGTGREVTAIKNVRKRAQRPLPAPNRPADRVRTWQA